MTLTKQQLDDLQSLLASPGWRLLTDMVEAEWGATGFGKKIADTLGTEGDTGLQLRQLQQATVAQREVLRVMNWPSEQINRARRDAAAAVTTTGFFDRRGGL